MWHVFQVVAHHVIEAKKGKVLDQKQADEWMKYMRPWLVTAGLTRQMIDETLSDYAGGWKV